MLVFACARACVLCLLVCVSRPSHVAGRLAVSDRAERDCLMGNAAEQAKSDHACPDFALGSGEFEIELR